MTRYPAATPLPLELRRRDASRFDVPASTTLFDDLIEFLEHQ